MKKVLLATAPTCFSRVQKRFSSWASSITANSKPSRTQAFLINAISVLSGISSLVYLVLTISLQMRIQEKRITKGNNMVMVLGSHQHNRFLVPTCVLGPPNTKAERIQWTYLSLIQLLFHLLWAWESCDCWSESRAPDNVKPSVLVRLTSWLRPFCMSVGLGDLP